MFKVKKLLFCFSLILLTSYIFTKFEVLSLFYVFTLDSLTPANLAPAILTHVSKNETLFFNRL